MRVPARHGLRDLELSDRGELIVHLDPGATYFNIVAFAVEAGDAFGRPVDAIPASVPAIVSESPLPWN